MCGRFPVFYFAKYFEKISTLCCKVYEKLYNGLNVLSKEDLEYKVYDDGCINTDDLLKTRSIRNKGSLVVLRLIMILYYTQYSIITE